ncbi:MAG: hypothetical protein MJZ85_01975 [Bacteroidales bacterium]|nr:hypothetical protein [Bacteroidales bacterium]
MGKSILFEKIERFIRKFYLNRLIQGALIGSVLMIVFYLIFNGIEYFSWLPQKGRLVLLILFVCISAFVIVTFFVIPIINLIRFRKKMSEREAAILIGKFFPEISDKLLNTLQLSENLSEDADNELLAATIEQRTENLKPINFSDAVNLKENYKYLKIFGLAFVILSVLVIFVPEFTKRPAERIINYSKVYEKPLPFDVTLSSSRLEVTQGNDINFQIRVTGANIPDAFYIKGGNGTRLMNKLNTNDFRFIFKNNYQNETFYVEGGDYRSRDIELIVRPNPTLLYYETELVFPKYIKRKSETAAGKTRVVVPQGTELKFTFHTRDVDSLYVFDDTLKLAAQNEADDFYFTLKALKSKKLKIHIVNEWNDEIEPMPFVIEVVQDAFPDIQVQDFHEEFAKQTYYSGLIADDYGFTKLLYHFEIDGKPEQSFVKNIAIDKRQTRTSFYYSVDLDTLDVFRGDEIKAYFEIFDNDGINGPKSRRSEVFYLNLPTTEQLDSIADSSENQIIDKLSQDTKELENLKRDIENMLRDLMAKKELDWSDKEKMKDLLEKQKQLQEEWQKVQEEQKELSDFLKDNELTSEELLKKQEEINKLFEEVISDDLKKMMEEIEKMLDEMPREKMQEMMKELKNNNENFSQMMDRNLSLLQQLKVEKEVNELINELNELGEKLESNTDSISSQDAKNQFNSLEKKMDSVMEQNKDLNDPFDISKDEETAEEINNDLEKAGDSENNNDNSGAQKKKKEAGGKMKKMAESLDLMMQGAGMDQLAEDAHLVRILLENVVRSSHAEEELMLQVGKMRKDDPSVSDKISRQKEISENFVMVSDSLRKMALRQTAIQNFVFSELQIIDNQLEGAMQDILELHFSMAAGKQQKAMMSMNNLALMLAESLDQMEMQMDGMSGSCSKPGKSKQSKGKPKDMKNMKDLQEQLGRQLKDMQQKMQQMQKDGQPMPQMSEELARMAAQQEMIREGMQKMLDEMKKNGQLGDDGLNEIMKDMEKLEEDIVNKRITNQTLNRHKNIMSRMLKAEKAQQEREKEEKRKSNEYKGEQKGHAVDELRYEESLKRQQDFLRTNPIEYQQFYREKINEYFLKNDKVSND